VIRCRGLRKEYRTGGRRIAALDGVDLEVDAGEFLAVVGPSGSGKSTLLMVLGGLIRPTAGEVHLESTRLDGLGSSELAAFRARTVGFVFQLFHLVPYLSSTENVLLAGFSAGGTGDTDPDRAEELLRSLGLEDRLRQPAGALSAGEQQRVAIARALYNDPPLLLADEPTGNLDPDNGRVVLEHLRRIHAEGHTVILVTHSPEVARSADRQVALRAGKLADGPA
jgi:putative ABC transport system ATP-binding protein